MSYHLDGLIGLSAVTFLAAVMPPIIRLLRSVFGSATAIKVVLNTSHGIIDITKIDTETATKIVNDFHRTKNTIPVGFYGD